jgi:hypothetical protein
MGHVWFGFAAAHPRQSRYDLDFNFERQSH